jgi:hypothetical protein
MNYTLIILGILLILVLYVLYRFVYDRQTMVSTKDYLKDGIADVTFDTLSNPASSRYTYKIWIYAVSLQSALTIFKVQQDLFELNLLQSGDLNFKIKESSVITEHIITSNFPLQKWVCVSISVDNNIVDSYLDGKLVKSQQLAGVEAPNKNSTITFGQDDVYIAEFERLPHPTDPQSAWDQYMAGNGGSWISNAFSSYGANLILTKDEMDMKKYALF